MKKRIAAIYAFLGLVSLSGASMYYHSNKYVFHESVYDPRTMTLNNYLTKVKHQGKDGICWAYSTTAVIESNILKNKLAIDPLNLDLSEKNLAYKTLNRLTNEDVLHNSDFDNYTNNNWLNEGSRTIFAGIASLQWNKLKRESENWQTALDLNDYKVTDYISLNHLKENWKQNVKTSIKAYGAVSISFDISNIYKKLYYNPNELSANVKFPHAATIVGWNDNIEANKFGHKTKTNGAWIVKNSWGDKFGEGGYFYLSYEALIQDLFTLNVVKGDEYTSNYYYDGGYKDMYENQETAHQKAAVSFWAKNSLPTLKEKLKAVNVGIFGDDNEVEIKIYKNNNNVTPNSLELGQLVHTQRQHFIHGGLRTIILDNPIYLEPNENFSIVAQILNPKGYSAIRFSKESNSQSDFSYIEENGKWVSSQKHLDGAVARIKAFVVTEKVQNQEESNNLKYAKVILKDKYYHQYNEKVDEELITVMYKDKKLELNKDYTLQYITEIDENIFKHSKASVGYTKVKINGTGTYTGNNFIFLDVKKANKNSYKEKNITVAEDIKHTNDIKLEENWKMLSNKSIYYGLNRIEIEYIGPNKHLFNNNKVTLNIHKIDPNKPKEEPIIIKNEDKTWNSLFSALSKFGQIIVSFFSFW
ncbi:C1 family peptidase [Mycoplasma phocimorsus]|uniref:C1 family peptidase n=1 Tax=Mycoplasma phocimorsus TaxID=3045839 RepID=UPI0024BFAA0C|nr:C1 family peptidase [Mycoplasma phocimorsus]MDJ1649024.1 C1 family peptidase [Mycoplasma phocimorsus]